MISDFTIYKKEPHFCTSLHRPAVVYRGRLASSVGTGTGEFPQALHR